VCFERGAVTSCFVATPEFRVIRESPSANFPIPDYPRAGTPRAPDRPPSSRRRKPPPAAAARPAEHHFSGQL
jgi:hypothetical protein